LNEGTLAEKLRSFGVHVYIIDEKENGFFQICMKSYRVLSAVKPQIVHSHRYKENLIATLVGILLKYVKVRTQHTTFIALNLSDPIKMRFYRSLDIINAKFFADKIIAVSDDINRQISSVINKDNIVTIHNFIGPKEVEKRSDYQEERFWSDGDWFLIGAVGRLVDVKGFKFFIEAAELVCDKIQDAKFIIVGSGPLYHKLEDQIEKAGLRERVVLTGFRNDVGNIIRSLDVFVMPSLYEGVPMTLLEAMILSKPIIASNVGGIPEVVKNGYNGILIPPKDENLIYENCVYLYENKNVRDFLGKNAHYTVLENFNGDKAIKLLTSLYMDLMN
jgi:glycosyltransferase involved in cell wall biosynthesis